MGKYMFLNVDRYWRCGEVERFSVFGLYVIVLFLFLVWVSGFLFLRFYVFVFCLEKDFVSFIFWVFDDHYSV